ncbi:HEAT repeat domain-containing protein [Cystobacter ferrugineus]|uniref:HEAT repeat domain-containing protein n=1 Tax=Cystobacter ferrugineus TaxID=83449 RepID=UPI003CCC3D4A
MHDPEVPWTRLAQLEARALAHAEALHAGNAAGLPHARELLAEDEADRVRASVYALALQGSKGVDEVVQSLADAPKELLSAWFEALALVPHSAVAVGLHGLLRSPRPEVRASAVYWLGWRREGEAALLLPLLSEPHPLVRMAAALALARRRHYPALQNLAQEALQFAGGAHPSCLGTCPAYPPTCGLRA